ncbi:hypothetical protein [Nannocystis pusilla]|uniref:hypothetical protein n=1 Tax=Nannocystis pusilla TaxID=889268 RepID=UPI003B7F0363
MSRSTLVLPLAAAACFTQTWADGSDRFPTETDSEAGSSATTSTGTSTSTGEPWQTVTGTTWPGTTDLVTGSSTSEGPAAQPPEISSFTVEPDTLHEAGTAEVHAVVSDDVVSLQLRVDGEEVWAGPPSEFAWSFAATSKAASEGTYKLELVARDGEGLTASATAMLWVTMPDTGTERCVFTEDAGAGRLTAAVYAKDALVVVGALANPSYQATVWRLDPDSCQPQAGYPWQLSQWSAQPMPTTSEAVGLALDAEGRMAIAANIGAGLSRQPYLAVLSPEGALEWEHVGPVGQTYSGVTAAPNRFVVVGEVLVDDKTLATTDSSRASTPRARRFGGISSQRRCRAIVPRTPSMNSTSIRAQSPGKRTAKRCSSSANGWYQRTWSRSGLEPFRRATRRTAPSSALGPRAASTAERMVCSRCLIAANTC